jgi:spore coat polysaccharide biosynthesis protein SpsF (cytidylyltransferase family)
MSFTLDTKEDLSKIKAIIEYLDGGNPGEWKIEKIIEAYKEV